MCLGLLSICLQWQSRVLALLQAEPLPPQVEPLILWEPPEGVDGPHVEVDPMLTTFLRPHQREGVQFIFECVAGLKQFDGQGEMPALL